MFEMSHIDFISSYLSRLDSSYDKPVISRYDMDTDDETSLSFIEAGIRDIYSSKDMKWARFSQDGANSVRDLTKEISDDLSVFRANSEKIVETYFEILKDNFEVPSGDLLVSLFEMDSVQYIAVLKYNYKTFTTSIFDNIGENSRIYIRRTSSLCATARTKPDEGFIVHLPHMDICMTDKKYNINSEKTAILADELLKCETGLSQKEKFTIFENVTENIERKYLMNDPEEKAKLKKTVKDSVLDLGYLSVNDVIQGSFEEQPNLKEIYKSSLEKSGIKKTENIDIDARTLKSKFQTQKITTESGISIDIPIEYYGDDSKIEFVPSDNGTLSIIIKNVKNIIA